MGLIDTRNAKDASYAYLVGLNAFAFTNGLASGIYGLIVLPIEALRLWPETQALSLGLLLASAGVTQLLGPAVGYYSDHCTHRWGRRRPFLLLGCIAGVSGLAIQYFARESLNGSWYVVGTMVAVGGLNAIYSANNGMIADLVPIEIMGKASGVMTLLSSIGAVLGFTYFGYFNANVGYFYPLSGLSCAVTAGIVATVGREDHHPVLPATSFSALLESFRITPASHGSFFWVFVIRTLYYMSMSVQAFIVLYLRDVTFADTELASDTDLMQHYVGLSALIALSAGAVVAVPVGKYSDTHGRKPSVRFAALCMAATYLSFAFAPPIAYVLGMGLIFGIGNGVFLAVDYALAVDTLPNPETSAKDLGLWGIATFIGASVGPLIGGPLLQFVGRAAVDATTGELRYGLPGYVALMVSGSCYVLGAALLLSKVTGVK